MMVIWSARLHNTELLHCQSQETSPHTLIYTILYCTLPPLRPPFLWWVKEKHQRQGGKRLSLHWVGCFFWFGRNRFCINGVILGLVSCFKRGKNKGWEMIAASTVFTCQRVMAIHYCTDPCMWFRSTYFAIQMIFLPFPNSVQVAMPLMVNITSHEYE